MSKHEIRLRRQKMTTSRFRNYGAVLHRHEEERRMKKILRVFGYFLVILIFVLLLVIVIRVERRISKPDGSQPRAGIEVKIRSLTFQRRH